MRVEGPQPDLAFVVSLTRHRINHHMWQRAPMDQPPPSPQELEEMVRRHQQQQQQGGAAGLLHVEMVLDLYLTAR